VSDEKKPVWKREVSIGRKKPVVGTQPSSLDLDLEAIKIAAGEAVPEPPVDVVVADQHAPVAAETTAEDPMEAAAGEPSRPFWRRELALGRKKKEKIPEPDDGATELDGADDAEPLAGLEETVDPVDTDLEPESTEESDDEELPTKKSRLPRRPRLERPARRVKRDDRGHSAHQKRLIGLKIGASQIVAARVSNGGAPELQQIARVELESGVVVGGDLREPEKLAEALRAFFKQHKLPKRGVRLGIANNRIGVRTFEIVGIDEPKQLANAIKYRAQDALPIPVEESVLDYQVLDERIDEEGRSVKRVLLVVAYRELVDRYIAACRKAGLELVGIDLEAFALLRAMAAPPEEGVSAEAALVVVGIGHERTTLAVSDGRVCEFARVLEWGGWALNVAVARALATTPSEAEPLKRLLDLNADVAPEGLSAKQFVAARDAVLQQIQSFARELVSSLQFYQAQPDSLGIGELVLTGGTSQLPGLAEELQRLLGVKVQVGDPMARVKVRKKVREEQLGSLAIAIGLGIED